MQLIGKVLRDGETVTLRHPDSSTAKFMCEATATMEIDASRSRIAPAVLKKVEEICSWDTNIKIDRTPLKSVIHMPEDQMQPFLAAHDPDVIARLRAALHLALVTIYN
jgi:hypothetical protein